MLGFIAIFSSLLTTFSKRYFQKSTVGFVIFQFKSVIRQILMSTYLEGFRQVIVSYLKRRLGNRYHALKRFLLQQNSVFLINGDACVNKNYQGYLEYANYSLLSGWVSDLGGKPINELEFYINDEKRKVGCFIKRQFRADLSDKLGIFGGSGFNVQLNRTSYKPKSYHLRVVNAVNGELIFDAAIKLKSKPLFERFKRELNIKEEDHDKNLLPVVSSMGKKKVDVIIPIYDGLEETLNCIHSVLNSQNSQDYNLILINDCSPNKALSLALESLCQENPNISYSVNPQNLGFVKTVNLAMAMSTKNDVLLLNADTLVSDYWLDRLIYVAQSSARIGTVTPLSNNATIFSFPQMNPQSDLLNGESLSEINEVLHQVNKDTVIDVPTAHGFCMYIKRDVINEVGLFNEARWGRGYCEENDFSILAELNGWRNVAACNVYVKHVGAVSFSASSEKLIQTNLKKLSRLYPLYLPSVQEFCYQDPIREARTRAAMILMKKRKKTAKYAILHICHALGGGTKKAMHSFIYESEKAGAICYIMMPTQHGRYWRLSCSDMSLSIDFDWHNEQALLVDFLRQLGINHCHYHQILQYPDKIRSLANDIACSYDVSLHDFYLICPRVNFLQTKGRLCDGPSVDNCFNCLKSNGPHESSLIQFSEREEVLSWSEANHLFLERARCAFPPSIDTFIRFKDYYDLSNLVVRPHPEKIKTHAILPLEKEIATVRVAIIGAIGENKGVHLLRLLLEHSKELKLPIEFIVFGYCSNDINHSKYKNLTVTGQFSPTDLPRLLSKHGVDRALFLSTWPETYSYTLSEALQAGIYPLAFDIGAFSERIEALGVGTLLPLNASEIDICDAILDLELREKREYSFGKVYDDFISDYYQF